MKRLACSRKAAVWKSSRPTPFSTSTTICFRCTAEGVLLQAHVRAANCEICAGGIPLGPITRGSCGFCEENKKSKSFHRLSRVSAGPICSVRATCDMAPCRSRVGQLASLFTLQGHESCLPPRKKNNPRMALEVNHYQNV